MADTQDASQLQDEESREQERFLPIANVSRIMKKSLPENAKISKEAKECVQECVSEFISFITSEASDRCLQEKRKTINGEDILWAMQSLGFENYSETMKVFLQRYRDAHKTDRTTPTPGIPGNPNIGQDALTGVLQPHGFSQAYYQQQQQKQ